MGNIIEPEEVRISRLKQQISEFQRLSKPHYERLAYIITLRRNPSYVLNTVTGLFKEMPYIDSPEEIKIKELIAELEHKYLSNEKAP